MNGAINVTKLLTKSTANPTRLAAIVAVTLMFASGGTLGAQSTFDGDDPDYQRAPTTTGHWRYDAPAPSRSEEGGAQRFTTIDRSRTDNRGPNRPYSRDDRGVAPSREDVNYRDETRHRSHHSRSEEYPVRPARYEWHPGRDQAPRAQMSEAPRFHPGTGSAPDVAMLPNRDYTQDRPAMPRRVASRGQYRPTSSGRTYELPPSTEIVQPQPETLSGPIAGGPVYESGGPVFGSEGFNSDGYEMDGFAAPGYDECGERLYSTPCPECGSCCGGISCPHRWLDESSVFAGVHAFKGGLDQGQNGNFGFQEGVNFAGSLWHEYLIGYQVGGQFLQSDLSGSNIANAFNNSRQQSFLTAGLYHRPLAAHGVQGGVVFDWLDDKFYSRTRFSQMRAEISYIASYGNEFGFWGAFATGSNQTVVINNASTTFGSASLYNFFYRKNFTNGDQGRIWGGYTGMQGGMVGADYRVHMSNQWDVVGGFNYLIPGDGKNGGGTTQESWGLAMNVVWYPTRRSCGVHNGPFRSLFGVADNNVFMVRQK